MRMETVFCDKCDGLYQRHMNSTQVLCNSCMEGKGWDARKNQLKEERKELENVLKKDTGKTSQNLAKPTEPDTEKTLIKSEKETVKDIGTIKKLTMQEKQNGNAKTESTLESTEENTTPKEKKNSESLFTKEGSAEILPMDSTEQSLTSNMVESASVNLIDESAKHLHSLMKGLFANQPEPEIRAYDPERVKAACMCADNIYKLGKLKNETLKVKSEFIDKYKGMMK